MKAWNLAALWVLGFGSGCDALSELCELLDRSDGNLWTLASSQSIGSCYLRVASTNSPEEACDFSIRGRGIGIPEFYASGERSFGRGCVYGSPRVATSCEYYNPRYSALSGEERDAMCTNSVVANAAAQLRHAIREGLCSNDPNAKCLSFEETTSNATIASQMPSSAPTETPVAIVMEAAWEQVGEEIRLYNPAGYTHIVPSGNGTQILAYIDFNGRPPMIQHMHVFDLDEDGEWENSASFTYYGESVDSQYTTATLSGDGMHILGIMTNEIVVFEKGNNSSNEEDDSFLADDDSNRYYTDTGHWNRLFYLAGPLAEDTLEDGTHSRVLSSDGQAAISRNGSQLAFPIRRENWNGFDWELNQTETGVYYWNGMTYVPTGNGTLPSSGSIFINSPGTLLLVGLDTYVMEDGEWHCTASIDEAGTIRALSGSGSRVALQEEEEGDIALYDYNSTEKKWSLSSVLRPPEFPVSTKSGFGASVDLDWEGRTIVVGAPTLELPRDPGQDRVIGGVYVYADCESVVLSPEACSFAQLGNVPVSGIGAGFQVKISLDGKFVFFTVGAEKRMIAVTRKEAPDATSPLDQSTTESALSKTPRLRPDS